MNETTEDHNTIHAEDPARFWEERYVGADRVWSGRPNQALVNAAEGLPAGRALDLGCGEGGDTIWLARRGWHATGVDISATAVARARAAADELGLTSRVELVVADLGVWEPPSEAFDLVSACFLQSPVELPRDEILRRAADGVAPGGTLLVVTHAAPPPWSRFAHGHEQEFRTPAEELAALDLPSERWDVQVAEVRVREATGPDGEHASLEDAVVLLRRR